MTKEEMLEKRRRIIGNQLMPVLSDTIYNLMEEWGKQQAVAFNNYVETTHTGNCIIGYYDRNSENGTRLTSEHVYNQFIEQQTENK